MEGDAGPQTLSDPPRGPSPGLRPRGRRVRLLAAAITFGVLLAGTAWGSDDHFPFGPFRMYATRQRLSGTTTWYGIEGVTDDGRVVFLPGSTYGMRRAELEGQLPRFVADPSLLGALAVAYARRRPEAPPLVELHLLKHAQRLSDGRPVSDRRDKLVATWHR